MKFVAKTPYPPLPHTHSSWVSDTSIALIVAPPDRDPRSVRFMILDFGFGLLLYV